MSNPHLFINQKSIISHPSRLVTASAVIYVLHFLLESKTALCENLAFWTIFTLGWAMARREVRFSWHILYFPLILYGIASTGSSLLADRRVHQAFEAMLWFKMLIFPAAVILHRNVP